MRYVGKVYLTEIMVANAASQIIGILLLIFIGALILMCFIQIIRHIGKIHSINDGGLPCLRRLILMRLQRPYIFWAFESVSWLSY